MTRPTEMFTAVFASLLLLSTGTNGQTISQSSVSATGPTTSSTRPTTSASGQVGSVTRAGAPSATNSAITTHTILVGKADHKFEPDVVQAVVGDIIQFQFYPVNHSIVRAEYGYPCVPYEMTGVGKVGFYSGFRPVDAILDDVSIPSNDALVSSANWRNSHLCTEFVSMILCQFSSTVQPQEVVSVTRWLG
ncbi:hypothetical protein IWZ00DRAFT_34340 [Phyllosticta capitalensis]|uniref:Extracellular serine-rich protein n=1 Tax=Phyllosticta capitalensis TaxID=121624 RepID=A0ABR1Z3Z1_9PEZI